MTANIVIVNDGQYRWGTERANLEAAMERRGWTRKGNRWIEPELRDEDYEDDPAGAYTTLCQDVQPAEGYGPDDRFDDGDLPVLQFREDLGRGVWSY